jgi:hypothetical protein
MGVKSRIVARTTCQLSVSTVSAIAFKTLSAIDGYDPRMVETRRALTKILCGLVLVIACERPPRAKVETTRVRPPAVPAVTVPPLDGDVLDSMPPGEFALSDEHVLVAVMSGAREDVPRVIVIQRVRGLSTIGDFELEYVRPGTYRSGDEGTLQLAHDAFFSRRLDKGGEYYYYKDDRFERFGGD